MLIGESSNETCLHVQELKKTLGLKGDTEVDCSPLDKKLLFVSLTGLQSVNISTIYIKLSYDIIFNCASHTKIDAVSSYLKDIGGERFKHCFVR